MLHRPHTDTLILQLLVCRRVADTYFIWNNDLVKLTNIRTLKTTFLEFFSTCSVVPRQKITSNWLCNIYQLTSLKNARCFIFSYHTSKQVVFHVPLILLNCSFKRGVGSSWEPRFEIRGQPENNLDCYITLCREVTIISTSIFYIY